MAEGFFGGFAQGFSSTYGRRRGSLADTLSLQRFELDKEKFAYEKEQDALQTDIQRQQLEINKTAEERLQEHQQYTQMLEAERHKLELSKQDLEVTKTLSGLLDPKWSGPARKAAFGMFVASMGIDPKSAQAKAMQDLITSMSDEESLAMQEYVTSLAPDAPPGAVTAMVRQMLQDPSKGLEMIKAATGQVDPASLELKAVIDPATGKSVYVPEQEAIGMQPAPSGMYASPEEQARAREAELILADDYKRVEQIRTGAEQARGLQEELDAFKAALDSGEFITGPGAGIREGFGRIVQFLGLEEEIDLEGLASGGPKAAEVMNTSSNRIVAKMADQLGRTTNMQLTFLNETVPNLLKTPDGNAIIIELFSRQNKRAQLFEDTIERYITEFKTLRPDGKPTVWEEIRRIDLANPVIDDTLRKEMETISDRNVGIDLSEALSSITGGISSKEPTQVGKQPAGAGFGGTNTGAPPAGSEVVIGSQKFRVTGFKKIGTLSYRTVEVDAGLGKTEELPVVWTTEQRVALPVGTSYVAGAGPYVGRIATRTEDKNNATEAQ